MSTIRQVTSSREFPSVSNVLTKDGPGYYHFVTEGGHHFVAPHKADWETIEAYGKQLMREEKSAIDRVYICPTRIGQ